MFCTQCGKKLKDTMLFCPNCGSPVEVLDDEENVGFEITEKPEEPEKPSTVFQIADAEVIPQTEEEPVQEAEDIPLDVPSETAAPEISEESVSIFDVIEPVNISEEDIPVVDIGAAFVPLEMEDSTVEEPVWEKVEPKVERKPPEIRNRDGRAVRLDGHAPRMQSSREKDRKEAPSERPDRNRQQRAARTYVPPKPVDPEDMFMDETDPFDEFDDMVYDDLADEEFEYEDEGESSFFLRHIRGIMGLSLLTLLALVCMIYVFSETGQMALAKMNLAWRPEVYSKVAYEYYESGLYEMSGSFYEKALARDVDNYNYALSAASAYIYGEETEKAASMLKKCITIDPTKADPYIYLLSLYPDSASRPWDVSQLLQQGYGRTGDDRLKSVAQ